MKGLIFIAVIALLSLVFAKNPPTTVLVIESAACGNCKYFNYRDVAYLLKKHNFEEVVNIKLLPTAHLRQQNVNGTSIFSHRFGDQYLRAAFAQICANNFYPKEVSLKWGSSNVYSRKSLNDTIIDFFPEDSGNKMLNCVYGHQGHEFAKLAYEEYIRYAVGGMLPIIIVDGKREAYRWNRREFFLDSICSLRADKDELVACSGMKNRENYPLYEENFDNFVSGAIYEDEIQKVKNEAFDYQKFWATPDEDDSPIVGFENRNSEKKHLKFFDSDDQ